MRRPAVLLGLLAIISVHALLLWTYHLPDPKLLWGDEKLYLDAAQAVLAGERPGLDMLWPPLYPRFAAAVLWCRLFFAT